jgi:hypothetical protein
MGLNSDVSSAKGGWGGQRLPVSCLWEVLRESHFDSGVLRNMASGCGFCCAGETDILLYHCRRNVLALPVAVTWSVRAHGRVQCAHLSGTDPSMSSCVSFRRQALEEVFLYYLKRWNISTDSVQAPNPHCRLPFR